MCLNPWDSKVKCDLCGKYLRPRKIIWVNEYKHYYELYCGWCGGYKKGSALSINIFTPFWDEPGWEEHIKVEEISIYKPKKKIIKPEGLETIGVVDGNFRTERISLGARRKSERGGSGVGDRIYGKPGSHRPAARYIRKDRRRKKS